MDGANRDTDDQKVPPVNQPNTYPRHINLSTTQCQSQRTKSHECIFTNTSTNRPRDKANYGAVDQGESPGIVVRPAPVKVSNTLSDGTLLFVVDLKPDPLISRYGSLDSGKVSLYRRAGRGRVLGSTGRLVLHQDGARDTFSIRFGPAQHSDSARRGRHHPLAALAQGQSKSIRVRPASHPKELSEFDDYIALGSSRKRKRGRGGPEGGGGTGDKSSPPSSEDEGPNYRSIEGMAKVHQFSDSDLDYSSNSSSASKGVVEDAPVIQRSKQLRRRLDQHPDDAVAWLECVFIQDDLLRLRKGDGSDFTAAERQSQAEIKLDMLKKALKACKPKDTERLQVAYMREAMMIWDRSKLDRKWRDLAGAEEGSLPLFKLHLECMLTTSQDAGYAKIKHVFVTRLRALDAIVTQAKEKQLEGDSVAVCEQILYVFLRATRFMYDSGYTEMAVAAWQALLEMHFCSPSPLILNDKELYAQFKEFWESEVPRIGEHNAKGWGHFAGPGSQEGAPEPKAPQTTEFPSTRNPYKAWAHRERHHTQDGKMPARFSDLKSHDEYDPYKAVLFEDIKPFLFRIPSVVLSKIRKQLVDVFLIFCGLSPAFSDSWTIQSALRDPFLMSGFHHLENALLGKHETNAAIDPEIMTTTTATATTSSIPSFEPEDESRRTPVFLQGSGSFAPSLHVLFPGKNWFPYIAPWAEIHGSGEWAVAQNWAFSVVKQLALEHSVEEMAEYHLALQCSVQAGGRQEAKQRAKQLLKKYPENVGLYNAYALAEFAKGNTPLAKTVVASATKLKAAGGDWGLFYTWAWMELEGTGEEYGGKLGAGGGSGKKNAIIRLHQGMSNANNIGINDTNNKHKNRGLLTVDVPWNTFLLLAQDDGDKNGGNKEKSNTFSFDTPTRAIEAATLILASYLGVPVPAGTSPAVAQGNLPAAINRVQTFNKVFRDLCPRPTAAEKKAHQILLQEVCKLVYYHARHGPHRPVELRALLQEMASLYRDNTILLAMLAWADGVAAMTCPLRARAVKSVLGQRSFDSQRLHGVDRGGLVPYTHVFAIKNARMVSVHAARAEMEKALGEGACGVAGGMWRVYLRFVEGTPQFRDVEKGGWKKRMMRRDKLERQRKKEGSGDLEPDGEAEKDGDEDGLENDEGDTEDGGRNELVRSVYARALEKCPGDKGVAMEGFGDDIGASFDGRELDAVAAGMVEWGVRLNEDLGGFVSAYERTG